MKPSPTIIALCGKGGVGKTSLSALTTRMLCRDPSRRVLAIDADPAVGLSYPLGVTVRKTVDDIRRDLIKALGTNEGVDKEALLRRLDYEMFSALEETKNLAFLAIGRPEGDGCYCQVNHLLRDLIKEIAGQFDVVVIDGEAGLEQINRRVMEMVTHLVIVSDSSLKGRHVADTIYQVSGPLNRIRKAGIVFNKIRHESEEKGMREANRLPLVHVMYEQDLIRDFDRQGRSFFELPQDSSFTRLEDALTRFIAS